MSTNYPNSADPPRTITTGTDFVATLQAMDTQIQGLGTGVVGVRQAEYTSTWITAASTMSQGTAVAVRAVGGQGGIPVMVPATSANITAGAVYVGVLMATTPAGQRGPVATSGAIWGSTVGLTNGSNVYVRANATTGAIERVAAFNVGDSQVGEATGDGNLVLRTSNASAISPTVVRMDGDISGYSDTALVSSISGSYPSPSVVPVWSPGLIWGVTNIPTTGKLRFPHSATPIATGYNAAGDANILAWGEANSLAIGDTTYCTQASLSASSYLGFNVGAATTLSLSPTAATVTGYLNINTQTFRTCTGVPTGTYHAGSLAMRSDPADINTAIYVEYPAGTWTPLTFGGVPGARTISTTAPLSGGGDLSSDRTLAISAGSSGQVLTTSGTTVGWAQIANANIATGAAIAVNKLAAPGANQYLGNSGGAAAWVAAPSLPLLSTDPTVRPAAGTIQWGVGSGGVVPTGIMYMVDNTGFKYTLTGYTAMAGSATFVLTLGVVSGGAAVATGLHAYVMWDGTVANTGAGTGGYTNNYRGIRDCSALIQDRGSANGYTACYAYNIQGSPNFAIDIGGHVDNFNIGAVANQPVHVTFTNPSLLACGLRYTAEVTVNWCML